MVTIQYRKEKCDCCGKTVEIEDNKNHSSPPLNWFEITVNQWAERYGVSKFYREVCSLECLKKVMNDFTELDKDTEEINCY